MRSMQCLFAVVVSCFLFAFPAPFAVADPIEVDRTDIRGKIKFTPNGDFVFDSDTPGDPTDDDPILVDDFPPPPDGPPPSDEMERGWVSATDRDGLGSSASGPAAGLPAFPPFDDTLPPVTYSLPVGSVPDTTTFEMNAHVVFDDGDDLYRFVPEVSPPLSSAVTGADCPAPGGCIDGIDFDECAGVIVVRFVRDATCSNPGAPILPGDPNYPQDEGTAIARRPPPIGTLQANTTIRHDREVRFPARACDGASCVPGMDATTYEVVVSVLQGTDEFSDTVRTRRKFTVDVVCNRVTELPPIELPCPVDDGCADPPCGDDPGGGDPQDVPSNWQVIGFEEDVVYLGDPSDPSSQSPTVFLSRGPDGNQRRAGVAPESTATPPFAYPDLSLFTLENVIPSTRDSLDPDYSYLLTGFHFLNDATGHDNQDVLRGLPCGPNLDQDGDTLPDTCGHVGWVDTNHLFGPRSETLNKTWYPGEVAWESCVNDPSLSMPPPAILDPLDTRPGFFTGESQSDWIFIDGAPDHLLRCDAPPPLGPDCVPPEPTMVDPWEPEDPFVFMPEGYPSVNLNDHLKPFVMDPGVVHGRLQLTDGADEGAEHLSDVLENLNVAAALRDPGAGTVLSSFVRAKWSGRPEGVSSPCVNLGSRGGLYRGSLVLDSDETDALAVTEPEQGALVHRYRIIPGQLHNMSGWYQVNRVVLQFDHDGPGLGEDWDGRVELNRDDLNENDDPDLDDAEGFGDDEFMNLAWNMEVTTDNAYCFGKIQVAFQSPGSPLSETAGDEPWALGRSATPIPEGTPQAVFDVPSEGLVFRGEVDASNPEQAIVNVAVPAGTYDLRPAVVFADNPARSTRPVLDTVTVGCGQEVCICTNDAPTCTSSNAVVTPIDPDGDGTCGWEASVDLCLNDCNGGGGHLTVVACADDAGLWDGATATSECTDDLGAGWWPVRPPDSVPSGACLDCVTTTFSDLPLSPVMEGDEETTYTFVVTDAEDLTTTECVETFVAPDCPKAVAAEPAAVCADPTNPTDVTLDGTGSTGCDGLVDWQWTLDAGCAGSLVEGEGSGDPTRTFRLAAGLAPETCTATLVVVDANGCEDTTTVDVEILGIPSVAAGDDQQACAAPGEDVVFSVAGSGAAVNADCSASYQWTQTGCTAGSTGSVFADPTSPTTDVVLDGDVTGDCEVCLTVTEQGANCEGCAATDCLTLSVNGVATADPGGPHDACIQEDANTLTLDGSGSTTGRPEDADCVLAYSWSLIGCDGAVLSDASAEMPVVTFDPDVDPGACEACLSVTHGAGCDDPACPSTTVCTPIETCRGPEADFTSSFSLNADCADDVRVTFVDQSTFGDCGPVVLDEWNFGGGTLVSSMPPVEVVDYSTSGVVTVTRTVAVDDCSDSESDTLCIPECVAVHPWQEGNTTGSVRIDLDCADGMDPCVASGDLMLGFEPVGFCCSDWMVAAGSEAVLTIGPCVPGGPTVSVPASSVMEGMTPGPGGVPVVEARFQDDCLVNALRAIGCDCSTNDSLEASVQLVADLTCGDETYPFNVVSPVPPGPMGPVSLTCSNQSCLDAGCPGEPPGSCPEFDCSNGVDDDGDGAADCADADCAGVPPCP